MNPLRQIMLVLSHWVDDVASAILSIVSALRPTRKFQVVERPFALPKVNLSKTREPGFFRGLRADKLRSSSRGIALHSGSWSCRGKPPVFSTPSFVRRLTD
jgi:hypothetical protein